MHPFWSNSNSTVYMDDDDDENVSQWWASFGECPLLNFETQTGKIRLITDIIQIAGALLYILAALRESRFLGYKMFIENLVSFLLLLLLLFN